MHVLRTDDARFENLHEYPFEPHYVEVSDADGGSVRMHYVDEGLLTLCPSSCSMAIRIGRIASGG